MRQGVDPPSLSRPAWLTVGRPSSRPDVQVYRASPGSRISTHGEPSAKMGGREGVTRWGAGMLRFYRVSRHKGDMLGDSESIEGVEQVLRESKRGRFHVDETAHHRRGADLPTGRQGIRWTDPRQTKGGVVSNGRSIRHPLLLITVRVEEDRDSCLQVCRGVTSDDHP